MAGFLVEENWWLYLVLFVSLFLLLAINVYVLVIWQHPDDKNEAYFPKAVVLASLTLAEISVILLSIDAANNSGNVECGEGWSDVFCGSLDMTAAWSAIFLMVFIFALFIVPYTMFFYEEDDAFALTGRNDFKKACCAATKYMVGVVIIVALITGILYTIIGTSDIPVRQYEFGMELLLSQGPGGNLEAIAQLNGITEDLDSDNLALSESIVVTDENVELPLSFAVFVMGLLSFVGWLLFVIFGGLGLVGIPIDCIRGFINRPQKLDRGQLAALELGIQRRCEDLLSVGSDLKGVRADTRESLAGGGLKLRERWRKSTTEASEFNQFKQAVICLEQDYENLVICKDYNKRFNPLKPFVSLLTGFVASIIAVIWIVHIIVYILVDPPLLPFLNDYFLWFDEWFPLFGVLSVVIFSLYLLAACVKGCFKFGLRLVWFTLHPMKPNGTYMNSFLFNCGIVLMCTTPVIQFTVQALGAYLRNTEVTNFFNVQVRYMRFFRYFFANNVFVYALLVIAVISAIYLAARPADNPVSAKNIREALQKSAEYQSAHAAASTHDAGGRNAEIEATVQ